MNNLIATYQNRIKYGRTIFIAGIPMLFEKVDYAIPLGIIMMILGIIIIGYYNKKIKYEKNKDIIINFIEEIIKSIPTKNKVIEQAPTLIKIKEIKLIDTFGKKYQCDNIMNTNNIDKIMYYDIDYDKITLFFDIYMFISKFKNIINLELKYSDNKLLIDYYNHYNKVISYIANMSDVSDALKLMEEDYYDNKKILDKIIKDILNKEYNNNSIKFMNNIFNNIIMENLKKFDEVIYSNN